MQKIFEKVCGDFDVTLTEFDGEGDHVHWLVNYPPKVSVSKLVNSLKGFLVGCSSSIILTFVSFTGKMPCGLLVIVRGVAEGLLLALLEST